MREQLFTVCDTTDVDASWRIWSRESLILAVMWVGANSPCAPSDWEAGVDRINRMNCADDFDVTNSGFFVNSALAPVLRFRRRFMSVCNVLKGIKTHAVTDTRVAAFWHRRHAVAKMGPNGPITLFEPGTHWIPPDLHRIYKWAMDASALLNEFVLKVLHSWQTARLQACYMVCKPRLPKRVWDIGPTGSYRCPRS